MNINTINPINTNVCIKLYVVCPDEFAGSGKSALDAPPNIPVVIAINTGDLINIYANTKLKITAPEDNKLAFILSNIVEDTLGETKYHPYPL